MGYRYRRYPKKCNIMHNNTSDLQPTILTVHEYCSNTAMDFFVCYKPKTRNYEANVFLYLPVKGRDTSRKTSTVEGYSTTVAGDSTRKCSVLVTSLHTLATTWDTK